METFADEVSGRFESPSREPTQGFGRSIAGGLYPVTATLQTVAMTTCYPH